MGSTELGELSTEGRNPKSERLDEISTLEMLTVMNDEDATVAAAVRVALPAIAGVVDVVASRIAQGGRLFYVGAGTSGRLGVLDASECPPTFGVSPELFLALMAGGDRALRKSSEGIEDSPDEGARDLEAAGFRAGDTVVGIAASGRTPYCLGALSHARDAGGLTVALCCVAGSEMARMAEHAIEVVTGPEVLTGSTRMKAGTATKMVLNMISTGTMVRQGAVYGNWMVNVQLTNAKLLDRGQRIVMAITGCDVHRAAKLLEDSRDIKIAIVMQSLGVSFPSARDQLIAVGGNLRRALSLSRDADGSSRV